MSEEKKKNANCPCTYPGCPRHGVCEKCKEYHHLLGQMTTCEKKKDGK